MNKTNIHGYGPDFIPGDEHTPYRRIISAILLRAIRDLKLAPSYHNPAEDLFSASSFLRSDYAAEMAALIQVDLRRALRRMGLIRRME